MCYNPVNEQREWVPHEKLRKQDTVCFLATDAALEDGAVNKVGAMWSFLGDSTTEQRPKSISVIHHHKQIALAELDAVIKAIEENRETG